MKSFGLATLLLAASAGPAAAQYSYSFTNSTSALIPDANPTGISSMIEVEGVYGTIVSVSLSLYTTGGYNGDLYAYLNFSGGGQAVLLNRVGRTAEDPFGYTDPGFNITLSDTAPADIHLYGGNSGNPLSGNWQPDGRAINPQTVLDTDDRTASFGSFTNRSPNGTWTLVIVDMATDGESTLQGWQLHVDVGIIPEPTAATLAILGLALLIIRRRTP